MTTNAKYIAQIGGRQIYSALFVFELILLFIADCNNSKISIIAQTANLISRYSLHYITAIFLILIGLIISRLKLKLGDSGNYLIPFSLFAVITFLMQLINGFQSYSYRELITLFVPVLIYLSFINVYKNEHSFNVDIIFYIMIVFFIIFNWGRFSLTNIRSISFLNSYSAFESKYAYYGLILQFYYTFKKDKPKMIISFIVCLLSLKRVAILIGLLLLMFHKRIPINKPVKKGFIIGTTIVFLLAPILIQIMCNDTFVLWFNNATGFNLNTFLSGRISKFNAVFDSGEMKYGWGSSTIYLTNNLWSFARYSDFYEGQFINIHSDILKIYCECSILGLFVFLHYHLKQVKNNWMSFLLMFYLFTDMLVNHHLGIGKVLFWVIVYVVIHEIKEESKGQQMIKADITS